MVVLCRQMRSATGEASSQGALASVQSLRPGLSGRAVNWRTAELPLAFLRCGTGIGNAWVRTVG
jgi:hypothetical protein